MEPIKEYRENEHCVRCNVETEHRVVYMNNRAGAEMRKGLCTKCGFRRQLPFNDIPAKDTLIHFGMHKGKKLSEVPKDYLAWCLKNMDLGYSAKKRFLEVINEKTPNSQS